MTITFPEAIERAQKQGIETTGTGWEGVTAWLIQRTDESTPMDDTVALIDKNSGDLIIELFDESMLDWPQAGGAQLVADGSFNPGQARVPKNNPDGGQWVGTAGELADGLSSAPDLSGVQDVVREQGGASIHPKTLQQPTDGYMVAVQGHNEEIPADEFFGPGGEDRLYAWIEKNQEQLSAEGSHIGLWHDTENNEVVLDVSQRVDDLDEAIRLGGERNQQAIWDVANGDEISTGGTGDRQPDDGLAASGQAAEHRAARGILGLDRGTEARVRPDDHRGGAAELIDRSASVRDSGLDTRGAAMLTVYDGVTYEWESPLAPDTQVTINGELAASFAAFNGKTVGGVLLDVEAASQPRPTFAGNPEQARVPKGNGERSGRWTDMVAGLIRGLGQSVSGMNPMPGDPPGNNQLIESGAPLPRLKGNHNKVTGADFNKDDETKRPFGEGPASKANQLYDTATEAEPTITNDMLGMLSEDQELTGLAFRIKEPTSLATKIRGDMEGKGLTADAAASDMWDVNRYTAMSSTENLTADINASLADLESKGYQVFKNKNTWGFPDPTNPYQGVNVKILSPEGQQIELQFHTPESWAVKEKQHTLYNQQKNFAKGTPEYIRLSEEMMKMSVDLPVPPGIETIGV